MYQIKLSVVTFNFILANYIMFTFSDIILELGSGLLHLSTYPEEMFETHNMIHGYVPNI